MSNVKTYIVGGAVRDWTMGKKPEDFDYLIVGADKDYVNNMIERGYQQVGADFPVLLSPSGDEYALARIERKTGVGYNGFECETNGVTLEEDLARRDLTINAMAIDENDNSTIIDPYGGREDIKNRVLRHVSPAFSEDPVRVLRVARFAARFGFTVAPETNQLMVDMVKNGEVSSLQRERVMQELIKSAEQATHASQFIKVLVDCKAWSVLFPEIPFINDDQMYFIDKVVQFAKPENKFSSFMAALCSYMIDDDIEKLQARIVIPSVDYRFTKRYALYSHHLSHAPNMQTSDLVTLFDNMNITNNKGEVFLQQMIDCLFCERMMNGKTEKFIMQAYHVYKNTSVASELTRLTELGTAPKGKEIGELHKKLRIEAISNMERT